MRNDRQTESTTPPDATVQRWAVIIRGGNGKGELLGQIHVTQADAERMAGFWQHHYVGTVRAEVVAFDVPTQGAPVKDARDLLP